MLVTSQYLPETDFESLFLPWLTQSHFQCNTCHKLYFFLVKCNDCICVFKEMGIFHSLTVTVTLDQIF